MSRQVKHGADLKRVQAALEMTVLKPNATHDDIEALLADAHIYAPRAICVNPKHISRCAKDFLGTSVALVAVVGFPLGANQSTIKALEVTQALKDGANEIDMVADLGAIAEGDWEGLAEDIIQVKTACGHVPLKVILETPLWSDDVKTIAAKVAVDAGAQFVKTCTGFLGGEATVADVQVLAQAVGGVAEIKASAGIRTFEQALALLDAGATRLGTSAWRHIMLP